MADINVSHARFIVGNRLLITHGVGACGGSPCVALCARGTHVLGRVRSTIGTGNDVIRLCCAVRAAWTVDHACVLVTVNDPMG